MITFIFLSGTYTHLLSGTRQRRKYLRFSKFFDCACARCSDPTELGSNLSTLRCGKAGCHGNVLCADPLHPNDRAHYACDACKSKVNKHNNVRFCTSTTGCATLV